MAFLARNLGGREILFRSLRERDGAGPAVATIDTRPHRRGELTFRCGNTRRDLVAIGRP